MGLVEVAPVDDRTDGGQITFRATIDEQGRLVLPPEARSFLRVGPGGVIDLALDRDSMQLTLQMSPETTMRIVASLQPSDPEQFDLSDEAFAQIIEDAANEVFRNHAWHSWTRMFSCG